MNLELIATKMQTDLVGVLGSSIFINNMPVKALKGVLLRPPYISTPIDYELPGWRKTRFNLSARGTTYAEAKALITLAIASATISNTLISGHQILHIRPMTEPVSFPISDGGFVEFLVIFEAVYVIVT